MGFSIDRLLGAYSRAVAPPRYGIPAYRLWDEHVLESLCRCFGVSIHEDAAAPLRATLERADQLADPFGALLAARDLTGPVASAVEALRKQRTALLALYREHARALAATLWGELGERTEEELLAAGLDPSFEPNIADYRDWL